MMKKTTLALLLCVVIAAAGCISAGGFMKKTTVEAAQTDVSEADAGKETLQRPAQPRLTTEKSPLKERNPQKIRRKNPIPARRLPIKLTRRLRTSPPAGKRPKQKRRLRKTEKPLPKRLRKPRRKRRSLTRKSPAIMSPKVSCLTEPTTWSSTTDISLRAGIRLSD